VTIIRLLPTNHRGLDRRNHRPGDFLMAAKEGCEEGHEEEGRKEGEA
jgi:hypothetical protein